MNYREKMQVQNNEGIDFAFNFAKTLFYEVTELLCTVHLPSLKD